MTLSLMMTATMLASCGSGYDGSESRKSGSYNNERTTAENYRSSKNRMPLLSLTAVSATLSKHEDIQPGMFLHRHSW